jgi:hypothetical protein
MTMQSPYLLSVRWRPTTAADGRPSVAAGSLTDSVIAASRTQAALWAIREGLASGDTS